MRFASRPLAVVLGSCSSFGSVRARSGYAAAFVSGRLQPSYVRWQEPLQSARAAMSSSSSSCKGRVALLQFRVSSTSKAVNHETARKFVVEAAVEHKAQLIVLPEVWNGPYATAAFAEYAEVLPDVGDTSADKSESARLLMELAKQHSVTIIGGSVPETSSRNIYNTCLCIDTTGKVVAKHRKAHLFDIDVPGKITFKESDTLTAGSQLTAFNGGDPFGMIGVGICYDIRFPEYALLLNQKYACNILVYPGAFNMTTGPAHWELLQRGRAIDNQCFVLTASPARAPPDTSSPYPHYTAWGHSTVVSPWGDVVATCEDGETIVLADLDMTKVKEMRQNIPTGKQKRVDMYKIIHSTD